MAERRMFAKSVIDSDNFLDMPGTSQLLYFHLGMRADDDGFVGSPRTIMRLIGANSDDLKILMAKRFIIQFEDGILLISHWKVNNFIRSDRYKRSVYSEKKELLTCGENGVYALGVPPVYQRDTQVRLGEVRLGGNPLKGCPNYKEELGGDAALVGGPPPRFYFDKALGKPVDREAMEH